MKLPTILLLPLLACSSAQAATYLLEDNTGGLIPDGSAAGLARSLSINQSDENIAGITVSLQISAQLASEVYVGDLYLYLTDGSTLVTLANRMGRSADMPFGYNDDVSIKVTLSDAGAFDIHNYRSAITGNELQGLSFDLVGTFQPDGRMTDPNFVVTGDARSSSLGDFTGLSADRTFTLFAADLSTGAEHQLDSWSIEVDTVSNIPEPSSTGLLALGLGFSLLRRKRS